MGLYTKVAGAWQEVGVDGAGGVPWAKVTGGTVTEYTKGDGSVMEVHTFNANGSLTVDEPGYAEVLLVSGGGSTNGGQTYRGSGGVCREGIQLLPTGALPVTIGTGGISRDNDMWNCIGKPSSLGPFNTGYARSGDATGPASGAIDTSTKATAYTSLITGTARTFGVQGANGAAPRANSGDSGNNDAGAGATGVVIVAVQKSPPTVSGVVATGGTVTEYTGDGTNGVLGQKYKVHRFTANGNLVVTQGGDADTLIVSGGGCAQNTWPGNGGDVRIGKVTLGAGTLPVVVGAGGAAGSAAWSAGSGKPSSLGGLATAHVGHANPNAFGAGATLADQKAGLSSSITGAAVVYGAADAAAVANSGNGGAGASNAAGSTGVVIVRYEIA